MSRSRAGILSGASQSILRFGTRKTTMGDIARIGGVAKATLYNHFRDKTELYAALVESEVDELIATCGAAYTAGGDDPLADALAAGASRVSEHAVLRRLVQSEPAVLGVLVQLGEGQGWQRARAYAATLVGDGASSSPAGDFALRWVLSHAGWPADAGVTRMAAACVATAARAMAATGTVPADAAATS